MSTWSEDPRLHLLSMHGIDPPPDETELLVAHRSQHEPGPPPQAHAHPCPKCNTDHSDYPDATFGGHVGLPASAGRQPCRPSREGVGCAHVVQEPCPRAEERMSDAYRWRPELDDWLERADDLLTSSPPGPSTGPDMTVNRAVAESMATFRPRIVVVMPALEEMFKTISALLPQLRAIGLLPCTSCLGPLPARGRCPAMRGAAVTPAPLVLLDPTDERKTSDGLRPLCPA